ncbi:hypothetical protein K505DRAFT_261510 [Melanomma pulvis-pyrius CBS 109.77]|uniref:MICOS complex subunit n=1 Tax=Melanomma pulvis-pyrius CBS 109.77 TaxID=1314802 RepID=A0A6A6WP31_9PLEO|nr:hypothetical protein K505DRAFT_261510 [Melanomma pulvis-pyrius CBS 109.77]
MAFRPLLRQRALVPAMGAVAGAGAVFYSARELHAEEPSSNSYWNRKPIYDDIPLSSTAPSPSKSSSTTTTTTSPLPSTHSSETPYRPTPTDRLAVQMGHVRLALYKQAIKAEDAVNSALTSTLKLEHSFTSTVRSLAPPKESSEKILPGALYVLVATMAGSIITRNRNVLLRASIPAVIGVGTAYAVIPLTMKNVGDLAWTYEERFPAVAEAHLQAKARVQKFVDTGKAHTSMTLGMVQDKVAETREKVEDWVKKGR